MEHSEIFIFHNDLKILVFRAVVSLCRHGQFIAKWHPLLSFTLEAKTATERFFEVMDEVNPIVDPANPKQVADPKGLLEFHDVHFRYPDAESCGQTRGQ